jgi:hypothetical protein
MMSVPLSAIERSVVIALKGARIIWADAYSGLLGTRRPPSRLAVLEDDLRPGGWRGKICDSRLLDSPDALRDDTSRLRCKHARGGVLCGRLTGLVVLRWRSLWLVLGAAVAGTVATNASAAVRRGAGFLAAALIEVACAETQ